MKASLLLLSSILSFAQAQNAAEYADSVCSPNVTASAGSTLPPCISITNIQTQCAPNGTQPIDYLAHAECMCNAPSTFFADWQGCRNCLFVHGVLSKPAIDRYSNVISSVSAALCSGTPTTDFAAIFKSVDGSVAQATSGVMSDQYPSQTAVSLYYTATSAQGPGAITGSATAATKAASGSATGSATTGSSAKASLTGSGTASSSHASTTSGTHSGSATAASTTGGSSSSSAAGAMPTNLINQGLIVAAAGGALLAAL